jgi:serine/threonine protein kinase
MLLSSHGIVKLCDFGLVTSIQSAQSEGNKDFTGTAHYMPPGLSLLLPSFFSSLPLFIELIKGAIFDARADVWSIGISLIELCEGIVPNARLHKRHVLSAITDGPSPTLKCPANWSAELSDFLTSCLQKEFSQRSTTAELLNHRWIASTVSGFRKNSGPVLGKLFSEVMTKKEELHQESLRLKEEEELRIQREKEEREEYLRRVKEAEEMKRRQLQLEEEKRAQEQELERERVERLRRYAEESDRKLMEMERERVNIQEMETEDYRSYLREDEELTRDLSKEGWMRKRAHYLKWWNLRWVSVSRGTLRYYLSNDSDDLMNERGIFRLTENTKLIISPPEQQHQPQSPLSRYSFILLNPQLTPSTPLPRLSLLEEEEEKGAGEGEGEEGDGRLTTVISSYDLQSLTSQDFFYFKCNSDLEKNQWVAVIQKNILFAQRQHRGPGPDHNGAVCRYLERIREALPMRGWVKKKGVYGFWNQRYFVLEHSQLINYTLSPASPSSSSSSSNRPRGIFPLSSTCHVHLLSALDPPVLCVYEKHLQVEERNWEVILRCETMAELLLWRNKIQKQIQYCSLSLAL